MIWINVFHHILKELDDMDKTPVWDNLNWRDVLSCWKQPSEYGHKGIDMVSKNTQVGCDS